MHNEIKVMEMNMFFEVQGADAELKLSAFDKTRVGPVSFLRAGWNRVDGVFQKLFMKSSIKPVIRSLITDRDACG